MPEKACVVPLSPDDAADEEGGAVVCQLDGNDERGEWADVIDRIAGELRAVYPRVSKEPAKATRKGKLRRDGPQVRTNGGKYYGQARP